MLPFCEPIEHRRNLDSCSYAYCTDLREIMTQ